MANTKKTALSSKQKELLDFIMQYVSLNSSQPSQREMMEYMNVKSMNAIQCVLKGLEKKGYLERQYKARGMIIKRREENPSKSHPYHRDLEGLAEFMKLFCNGDSALMACAEAAWYRCMDRNHPLNAPDAGPFLEKKATSLAGGEFKVPVIRLTNFTPPNEATACLISDAVGHHFGRRGDE